MDVLIRDETPNDEPAIREVNNQAFGQPLEARLVEILREHDGLLLSLVAVVEERIVGHILFTPVTLTTGVDEVRGAGLGPMAVLPEFQRVAVGSKLIISGIERMKQRGVPFIAVLGHAAYYPRFGFQKASDYGVRCQWEVPDDAFMIMPITDRPPPGLARYRDEFMTVS
jgi:putative acetyltransferase